MEQDRADLNHRDATGKKKKAAEPISIDADRSFWRQFAEATTPKAFCQSWLPLQCRFLTGVKCAMVLLGEPDQGPFTPVAVWPDAKLNMKHLSGTAERAIRERRGFLVNGNSVDTFQSSLSQAFHVAYPIEVYEKIHGVVVLEVEQQSRQEVQGIMRQLHWGAAWLEVLIRRTEATRAADINVRLQKLLDLTVSAVEHEGYHVSAMAFVNKLSILLNCDRVSLGFLKKDRVQVSVLSHNAEFGKQMNLMRAIGLAMDEAVDQKSTIMYPPLSDDVPLVIRDHEKLAQKHDSSAILTIPLETNGRFFGGMTLERSDNQPFDKVTLELCETAAGLIGPILKAKRQEERWIILKLADAIVEQLKYLLGPGHLIRKMVAICILALVLFSTLFKMDYRVTAAADIEGEIKRAIAAPFNGYVKDAPIRAGDTVNKGQIICLLDDRDLKLERLKWSTEWAQLEKQYNQAMAKHERSQAQIAKAKIKQAEAQIDLLDEQLSRTKMTAPFDAVVMSGDLSQSLGTPVEKGDVLFEVAPLDAYRVIIEVDERDISHVAIGQKSELIFSSIPGESFPITVKKITPVTTAKEGRSYFRVEGQLEKVSERLRPGMKGIAKITVDRRRLIWIWTHKAVGWLRLLIWRWWP